MNTSNQNSDTTKTDVKNLWIDLSQDGEYQYHATIFSTDATTESDETISFLKKVNIMDLEKRKEIYGVCGECNEPGTGEYWCQPCNAKRLKENFKNWTSGNKNIDELIQQSQLNAVVLVKFYLAYWPEGNIKHWDIENQEWVRFSRKVALKSLNNSSNISHFHATNTVRCFGITQDPNTKDYMMILEYYGGRNLRNTLTKGLDYKIKMYFLFYIIEGLSGIHDTGNIHKDFHSGNILHEDHYNIVTISDFGMCQPVNDNERKGIYGVIPYMAPEVLRGYQYTKAADIYSFGIIMNELMSEEIPYNDIPHDHFLVVKICKGFRPKISQDTPKLIVDLIIKCWDDKAENRPTAKELCQILYKYSDDIDNEGSEIYSQIKECKKIKENKSKNSTNENKSKNIQTHPQAIYTSRLLKFKNLPEPFNSTDYLFSYQETISSSSANPISECMDCELNESDLNQDDDE
ncbi:kinase-like domain-containing protein [Rhizophagus diaphanus]|nr:kinase-like domain-containing protein [Rhizophagus diaphanus] [Rhizophagus sp. MUCL 43196]